MLLVVSIVEYRRRVRYSDCDVQGVVFNANYFVYWDDTITDYFDALDIPWSEINERGFDIVVAHAEIDFRSPGRVGDVLVTEAQAASIGRTSLTFSLHTWCEADQRTIVEGKEIQVVVDVHNHRPVPVPEFLTAAIACLQDG